MNERSAGDGRMHERAGGMGWHKKTAEAKRAIYRLVYYNYIYIIYIIRMLY